MGKISDEVLEIFDIMEESIKLNADIDQEEIERIEKIKEYIEKKEE